jgi:uncharacterized protein YgiM (DUF1202 family)
MESDKGSENPPVAGSGGGADLDRATRTPAERKRGTIGAGLIAAMVLSAAAFIFFIYFERSATETTSTPTSVQQAAPTPAQQTAPAPAPKPEQKAADAARPAPAAEKPAVQPTAAEQAKAPRPPAATSAPAQPAPTASSTPSPPAPSTPAANAGLARPPGSQAPPGSADSAPVQSAQAPPAASLRDQPTGLPARETVVVQKPRVNIRSEPTRRSRVVGSARKGEQFKVIRRTGSWVQVEGAGGSGWIGGRVLESVAR